MKVKMARKSAIWIFWMDQLSKVEFDTLIEILMFMINVQK